MSGPGKFEIEWINRGGPPQQPPNAAFPNGCHIDMTSAARAANKVKRTTPSPDLLIERSCMTPLPYPTGKDTVGGWMVRCLTCGMTAYVTAASRPDDPRSVRLSCKERAQ